MSFMQPEIVFGPWVEVDGPSGTEWIDADLVGQVEEYHGSPIPIPEPFATYTENKTATDIKTVQGWGARLSAPGYLDTTPWTVFETEDFTAVRPLLDWLTYNGFTVRTMLLRYHDDGEGRRRSKRNVGVDLAIDAMETAGYVDNIYLFSGDGDFRSLVEALQRRGVFVTVVSTMRTKPAPAVADELRRQADAFLELSDLETIIARA